MDPGVLLSLPILQFTSWCHQYGYNAR